MVAAVIVLLSQQVLRTYVPWNGNLAALTSFAAWFLSATTEPNFYTSAPAGLGMLIGGAFAHRHRKGFVLACGSGLWPAVVTSALLGVLVSNLVWGWTLAGGTWQPTFVPFVSVSPAIVLVFGPGWRNIVTGAVLGGVVTTPFSLLGTDYVCAPLGLPPVIGVTGGMAVGGLVAFALCRFLPWLHPQVAVDTPPPSKSRMWTVRRVLADFSEAQFFGNEWASAGLILGAVVAYLLNPTSPVYGSGLFPQVLLAQFVTAAVGMALWRNRWLPFYPTFVPIVSVAPAAVLAYGGTLQAILVGGVLGAAVAPPLAHFLARHLPAHFHPFIGNVASMSLSTALIVPALGLLPGFTT
ncbi:hypothetical protein [Amycolatopsis sp.]|uniref:hypothetical protein n=1 Tax=Amycolatopsis sp. TaxID=37632 RepID=UPI002C0A1177|nr:hypothetical protein [Amycolatopsis sp.]HVV08430.1 hypothetical protein [Amycolatopsis sp.]